MTSDNPRKTGVTPNNNDQRVRFERLMLPHLAAAYNLARWLVRREQDAQDIVQEAFLRAYRYFDNFRGGSDRAWLLGIVRNLCFDWFRHQRRLNKHMSFDEEIHSDEDYPHVTLETPETLLQQHDNAQLINQALAKLAFEHREVVILRDMEGLSYKEIASLIDIPVGTVMSRLARGRKHLAALMQTKESCHEL